jgi:sulfane dehydrogenase subunit SoxC
MSKRDEKDAAPVSRRAVLAGAAGAIGGAVLAGLHPGSLEAQQGTAPAPVVPADPTTVPGVPSDALNARAPFEHPAMAPTGVTSGASLTPLQDLAGTITPADLHFQRHHNGIALVDPARYQLVVHGMVDRPLIFSLEELKRFPAETHNYFIECAGNGRAAYRAPKREMTPQMVDGMSSNSEWTGVPLATLLREAGVRSSASWLVAEGGDASKLERSVPLEKAMDDALVAYAQNGEALRPANGYPVRLLLPGFEGNTSIKWLRRIELVDGPVMARDETSKYTDPLPNGTARQFSFVMDAKSIITSPAHPTRLGGAGWWPVSGLAWSGRGRITRVDVSTDGGRSWTEAVLQGPVHPKAYTRFTHMWQWDGRATTLMSRAVDETGYVQPTLAEFRRVRGTGTDYHYNYIRAWDVAADGQVFFRVDV